MDRSTLEAKDTFFTHSKFDEVCERIEILLGTLQSIEYIGCLDKKDSIHTLWKTRYSKSSEDILWQARLTLDLNNPKIIRMSIN